MNKQRQKHQSFVHIHKKSADTGTHDPVDIRDAVFQNFLQSPNPNNMTPEVTLSLQRTIGNQATIQLLRERTEMIQRDDVDDEEADPLDAVMQLHLDKLRNGTVELQTTAGNIIKNLASDTKGKALVPPPKGMDRIVAKAKRKVQDEGKAHINVGNEIKDILRGTIVYDDFDQLSRGYKKAFKELKDVYKVSFVKFSETFTQEGKEKQAAKKKQPVDKSGYADAKMVFNLDIPDSIRKKYFTGMFRHPKTIPVEMQFNTLAGLAVKSGKISNIGDGADPKGNWFYRIEPDDPKERWRFDAKSFVTDIIERMNKKKMTVEAKDEQLLANLPKNGLPPAHDVYDPVKKAEMTDADVTNAETFYPQLYDIAFRYSKMDDKKAAKLSADVRKIIKKAPK